MGHLDPARVSVTLLRAGCELADGGLAGLIHELTRSREVPHHGSRTGQGTGRRLTSPRVVLDAACKARPDRLSFVAMTSLLRHPMGWILLVVALAQPGWMVTHALVDHDSQQHHGIPSPLLDAETPNVEADRTAHEHGHLDDALVVTARTQQLSSPWAVDSSSSERVVLDGSLRIPAIERTLIRAGPESATPSHPRAPPHA